MPESKLVDNVQTLKPKRTASMETQLKREMAQINRDLAALDKRVDSFEAMKAEMKDVEATRDALQADLDKTKDALIKELGLA